MIRQFIRKYLIDTGHGVTVGMLLWALICCQIVPWIMADCDYPTVYPACKYHNPPTLVDTIHANWVWVRTEPFLADVKNGFVASYQCLSGLAHRIY